MNARELRFLADLIDAGRLRWPPDIQELRSTGVAGNLEKCCDMLAGAAGAGAAAPAAGWMLRRIAEECAERETIEAGIQAVVSGPCLVPGTRGTEDALREVIDQTKTSLLMTGFVLHNGRSVLSHLAQRMDRDPALGVLLCLDVSRAPGDTSDDQSIISGFVSRFRQAEWPGMRLPRLFYDPRSLAKGADERSVLHAKIAVADSSLALIGSANLTEAALRRNIEFGLLVSLPAIVSLARRHFETLIHNQVLVPAPL